MNVFGALCRHALTGVFIALTYNSLQAAVSRPQQLSSPDQVPSGLKKAEWRSIRAVYESGRHAFQSSASEWHACNPGQQWTTTFDRRGFVAQPFDGGWQWGLALKSYGFGEHQKTIEGSTPVVTAEAHRLTYDWDGVVQEWFVNDDRGLEHGFIVKQRPTGKRVCPPSLPLDASPERHDRERSPNETHSTFDQSGEDTGWQRLSRMCFSSTLTFVMSVKGTLQPMIARDREGVLFQDATGAIVLKYSGLKVWDADGKMLPSYFEKSVEGEVRLLIEECGARYPLTIDPIAQQAYLKAHQVNERDEFGHSVAVSGDTVVVGAHFEDSSTTVLNGSPDESAESAGAAYVFVRSGTNWTQQAYLKAPQSNVNDEFGWSVAISGDTVVIGARLEDSSSTGVNSTANEGALNAGAAYVFVRSGTNWTQQAYLKAHQVNPNDQFGWSVAVSGDTVVVGAVGEQSSTTGINSTPDESTQAAGAVYVFIRSGTNWSQQAYLKAHQVSMNDEFGRSVAVSGDIVVVGAYHEDSSSSGVNSTPNESAAGAGAAYVFARSGTNWTQQAYLKAHQVSTSDRFGTSVAVSGDTVVVGAIWEDSSTTGVNKTPDESRSNAGAAYVFVRSGTNWTQQAYLKAHQVSANDFFGRSVAVSGDTVVVGADWEASSMTGVNSTPDESAASAGAAYVFVRSGIDWTQQAYLKAHQVNAGDLFGGSVAVSGDVVIVGAVQEDSSTTGVNSTPDESAMNAGSAYIFTRPSAPRFLQITSVSPLRFRLDGAEHSILEVEVSTTLTNWLYVGLATNISNNLFQFTDSNLTNFPHRFYRVKVR